MTDSEFTMFVFLWIFGGIILFQWWRIHRYRKKIERFAEASVAAKPGVPALEAAPAPHEAEELRRIKERLKVLERIAVEKENALAREIEDLRAAG